MRKSSGFGIRTKDDGDGGFRPISEAGSRWVFCIAVVGGGNTAELLVPAEEVPLLCWPSRFPQKLYLP
jgi:hypothetical protein